MKTTSNMVLFWSGVFSNFFPAKFVADGITFANSEQYFMYQKALTFGDLDTAQRILECDTPAEAKALGKTVDGFNDEKWSEVRYDIMMDALRYKFDQNLDLKQQLIDTDTRILVEASPYDCIWGIGLKEDDPDALDQSKWRGKNLLGEALMQLRREYVNGNRLAELFV